MPRLKMCFSISPVESTYTILCTQSRATTIDRANAQVIETKAVSAIKMRMTE